MEQMAATPDDAFKGTRAEALRRRMLSPSFSLYLLGRIPLAALAGVRVRRLDSSGCEVTLPGGWRTQNPFRSTYFAAQAMAAELSTGAPAACAIAAQEHSISSLVLEFRARYLKKISGPSRFVCEDVPGIRGCVASAAASGEGVLFQARSVGYTSAGERAAEFEVTWSFRRRG